MIGKRKTKTIMMTGGAIWKQLLAFSMPLLMDSSSRQLCSMVDSIVVGNHIGSEALAAVGFSNSLISLIVGMFMEIAIGAGIIISQYYGGGEEQKLRWVIHTYMVLNTWGGIFLTMLDTTIPPIILKWMDTPEEVMNSSVVYFHTFFDGSLFNLVYGMSAGIPQTAGDSRRPLYYLYMSSVVNIMLDLVFVMAFRMGMAGVDYAMVAAQFISAMLVMLALTRSNKTYWLELSRIKINKQVTSRVLRIGIPNGVQQPITSLPNTIVQTDVSSFGATAMAGFGSYYRIDGFMMLSFQSFYMAAITLTGQGVGTRNVPRVKKGTFQGLVIDAIYTAVISAALFLQVDRVPRILSSNPAVLGYSHRAMHLLLPFYTTMTIHNILVGNFREASKTMVPMLIDVGNTCILHVIYTNLAVPFFPSYDTVMLCYPITWITIMLMDTVYYVKAKWLPRHTIAPEPMKSPCLTVETVQRQ